MEKPGRRLDSVLKWEYFYYDDCLVLTRKNKVIKISILQHENILRTSPGFDILQRLSKYYFLMAEGKTDVELHYHNNNLFIIKTGPF